MRIMVDTNVLFSAILFPKGQTAKAIQKCINGHTLVIPSYVVDELKKVVKRKFPNQLPVIDMFFEKLSFELVYTPEKIQEGLFIRDPKDYPVLYSAITENVDVLITGDGDFKDIDVEHPEILSPAEFTNKY